MSSSSADTQHFVDALHNLAKLYQFRSVDQPLYRSLTVSQSYCMKTLCFRGPQKMSALAGELKVRLSTMTGVIDQLEARELVKRVNHPKDRRSIRVELTPKGRRLYLAVHEAFVSHLEPVLTRKTPAEKRLILGFLSEVTQAIQEWMRDPWKAKGHGQ